MAGRRKELVRMEFWGDILLNKLKDTIRIMFQNVGGLPTHNHRPKNTQLRQSINDLTIDIFGISEVNVNWAKLPFDQRFTERLRGWWETHSSILSYNTHKPSDDAYVVGGTITLAVNRTAHCIVAKGVDTTGLGRWSWILLRGRHNLRTRIVTIYRPVHNLQGSLSVYNQQRRFYLSQGKTTCPLEQFTKDLVTTVTEWASEGDQLIVGGDLNEPLTSSSLRVALEQAGLVELFSTRHGNGAPSTYQRGSNQIDSILVSPSLAQSRCGFLAFGSGLPSDHRALWVELPTSLLFGHEIPELIAPRMRRLQCRDPRVVKAYVDRYLSYIESSNLAARAAQLQSTMTTPPPPSWIAQWDDLDSERVQAMHDAERRCRKLRVGQTPWSPELQAAIDSVTLWQLTMKRLTGCKVSSKLLARLRKTLGVTTRPVSQEEAYCSLRSAQQHYRALKHQALSLRTQWIEGLANARAQTKGGTSAS